MSAKVRIVVTHEQSLFREAIKFALSREADFEMVGESHDGCGAVEVAEQTRPDVMILGKNVTDGDCARTAWLIRQRVPGCRVMVLADSEDHQLLAEIVDAGASGYITNEVPLKRVIDAIRAMLRDEISIPARMMGPLLSRLFARRPDQGEAFRRMVQLTPRERQVLALLVEGFNSEMIARDLAISPETARTHVQNVLHKLGMHSRLEAAAFVRKHGVLEGVGVDMMLQASRSIPGMETNGGDPRR